MAKTVFVVFDTDLEEIVGVYNNQEAAEDCENSSPGDRYTKEMVVEKLYNEDTDPRAIIDETELNTESARESYDDDELYEREDEDDDDEEADGD